MTEYTIHLIDPIFKHRYDVVDKVNCNKDLINTVCTVYNSNKDE